MKRLIVTLIVMGIVITLSKKAIAGDLEDGIVKAVTRLKGYDLELVSQAAPPSLDEVFGHSSAIGLVSESNGYYEWYLLPQYYFDYEVDSLDILTGMNLDYVPTDDVFKLFPAIFGLWHKQPYSSLYEYVQVFQTAAKTMGGFTYEELANQSATKYNNIPGWDFCFKFFSDFTYVVWFSHILWRDNIAYNIFYCTTLTGYNSDLNRLYFNAVLSLCDFEVETNITTDPTIGKPVAMGLDQNFPNPFNAWTCFRYSLNRRSDVRVAIYNAVGRMVHEVASGMHDPGEYRIDVDFGDEASGTYIYLLETGTGERIVKKAVLVK